jgi:predicted nucleotidyltransferase
MASSWRDIDIAVISSDFSDDLFEERLALMRIAAKIDDPIEPHPFAECTFNSNNPLGNEIQKNGIKVA